MSSVQNHYPKFLAFVHLIFPNFFDELACISNKSDLVEAKLLSSNCNTSFQATVFSEGNFKNGDVFQVLAENLHAAPYSWDWRWVFALKILYNNHLIFPLKFKKRIIALPTGKNPLSMVFFNNLTDEFEFVVQNIVQNINNNQKSVYENYEYYLNSVHIY